VTSANPSRLATERSFFPALWALSLVIKLILGATVPLSPDEAYYWVWSHKLDVGYFDHPPLIAWLFALGHPLEFFGHAVRWPGIILAHIVPLTWWLMLRNRISTTQMNRWMWLFLACPLTGIGGIVMTPDLPLLLFWTLALKSLLDLLDSKSNRDYALLGLWLGLGFCSKYHIVLLPFFAAFALFIPDIRRRVQARGILITGVTGFLACLPVLAWNFHHDWISFRFQLGHGLAGQSFLWKWPAEYLLGEILLISPLVLWTALKKPVGIFQRILFFTGFGPFAFFFLTSFRASTELNWPAMAFPLIFALSVFRLPRRFFQATVFFWGLVHLALLAALAFPGSFHLHGKISEAFRYRVLGELVNESTPLYASSYQLASSLWYVSKTPVYKLSGMSRMDMYDFWPESIPSEKKFRLLREEGRELPEEASSWSVRFMNSPAPGLELLEIERP
jgi:4-amino-4-deoxy-L-arabinose transferase-like glycosyltransferase